MTRITLTIFAGLLLSRGLEAQEHALTAKIPFAFHIANRLMPSGEYVVRQTNGFVILQGIGLRHAAITAISIADHRQQASRGELVFNRYGDQHYLSQVWPVDSTHGRAFPKGRQERELAVRFQTERAKIAFGK